MERRLASALFSMGLLALSCELPTTHGLPSVSAPAPAASPIVPQSHIDSLL